jgi:hypothetical protein
LEGPPSFISTGWRVFAGVRGERTPNSWRRASDRGCPVLMDVTDQSSIEQTFDVIGGDVGDAGLQVS